METPRDIIDVRSPDFKEGEVTTKEKLDFKVGEIVIYQPTDIKGYGREAVVLSFTPKRVRIILMSHFQEDFGPHRPGTKYHLIQPVIPKSLRSTGKSVKRDNYFNSWLKK